MSVAINPTSPQEAYAALAEWAGAYANMWDCADGFHGSLTMTEVLAQARLLRAAGRPDLAAILLREWTLIEHAEYELDDGKREQLAEVVALLPEIPDHREDGPFDWTPYITPEVTP
jgi:hypothetical protein